MKPVVVSLCWVWVQATDLLTVRIEQVAPLLFLMQFQLLGFLELAWISLKDFQRIFSIQLNVYLYVDTPYYKQGFVVGIVGDLKT